MKKVCLLLALIMAGAFLLAGCQPSDRFWVEGRALELKTGGFIIVSDSNEPIVMADKTKKENAFKELSTGDKIKVKADMIMETYPAQTSIYKLKFIEDGSLEDIDKTVLDGLSELGWEYIE